MADAERAGSLQHSLTALLTVANAVRDQLSVDTWLAVNDLERVLDPLHQPGPDPQAELQVALDDTMTSLLALAGLATESMVRDPGWAFMDAGRRIERARRADRIDRIKRIGVHASSCVRCGGSGP